MRRLISVIWPRMWLPLLFLFVMWVVELSETLMGANFSEWGVHPRDPAHLYGILVSPFLHGQWDHIFSNSLPFIVLSGILFLVFRKVSYIVFLYIYLVSGLAVWLMARTDSVHIGASGLVYGLFGFVFFSGIFRRDIKSIGVSLVVGFFYGGMVWGVLPNQPGVSWESHLFGLLAGLLLAYHYRNVARPRPPEWMQVQERQRNFSDFIDRLER